MCSGPAVHQRAEQPALPGDRAPARRPVVKRATAEVADGASVDPAVPGPGSAPTSPFAEHNHLSGLLTLAARLVQQELSSGLAPLGVSYAQVTGLVRLYRSPGGCMPQRELVRSLAIRRASGTLLLQDLESLGLIERKRGPGDRRQQLVRLTAAGRALEPAVHAVMEGLELRLREAMGSRTVDATGDGLRSLLSFFDADTARALPPL